MQSCNKLYLTNSPAIQDWQNMCTLISGGHYETTARPVLFFVVVEAVQTVHTIRNLWNLVTFKEEL